jgi:hypothetical protein
MDRQTLQATVVGRRVRLVKWKDGQPARASFYLTILQISEHASGSTKVIYHAKTTTTGETWDLFAWQFALC